MPDFKDVAKSFKGTFKKFFNPYSYAELFEEGPREAVESVKNLIKSDVQKDPVGALGNLGTALFVAGLPAMDIAGALNPNREDMKYAGPFEEIATRLSETGNALVFAHDPFTHNSGTLWGSIPAFMLASPIINTGARYAGKALDYLSGNAPPPKPEPEPVQKDSRFDASVKQEMERLRQLYPHSEHGDLARQAINNTLLTAQKYMSNVKL